MPKQKRKVKRALPHLHTWINTHAVNTSTREQHCTSCPAVRTVTRGW